MSDEGTPLAKAEAVARGLARKLRTLEAERAAEAIDSEALFNQLERSHAALRAERDALAAKHAALAAEQAKAGAVKDSLTETIDQLRRDKRAQDDALKRLTAAERAWVSALAAALGRPGPFLKTPPPT
jgi:chromosome segregation ATPase